MIDLRGNLAWQVCIACLVLCPIKVMADDALTDLLAGTPGLPPVLAVAAMRADASGFVTRSEFLGSRRVSPEPLAVNEDTLFRVASVSKLVTALGFMRLVEQGKIDLDADVSEYLGFSLSPPGRETLVSSRMLLAHTSAVRDGDRYVLPPNESIRAFFDPGSIHYAEGAHYDNDHPPGAGYFHYANLNYGLLGTVIERVSGQRFDRYMQSQVLDPLSIEGSFNVNLLGADSRGNLSTLYRYENGQWLAQADDPASLQNPGMARVENPDGARDDGVAITLEDYVVGSNGTVFSPQGGLRITLPGLLRIARLLLNRGEIDGYRLLRAETISAMERVHWAYAPGQGDDYGGLFLSFGLGVQHFTGQHTARGGDRLYIGDEGGYLGHLGEAYGLLSGLFYRPQSGEALVYVINGISVDPSKYPGSYSSFYRWEESLLSELGPSGLADDGQVP